MKAVILAGGRGSRLAPLTDSRPKPLMPVVGRPLLQYVLDWMTTLPITDVYLTLGYLGEQVVAALGAHHGRLRLHHVVEAQPLGTAGSVAALRRALDETTLVISGDLLVDLDLTQLLELHRRHEAWVSLVLTRTPDPSPYGAVLSGPDGRLVGFLEKPAPDQHLTDTVNAGIYLLEPAAIAEIPSDTAYDFSRDLFPRLLQAGRPMVATACPGYWRDIGSLESYRQANLDLLAGCLRWRPAAPEIAPGLYAAGEWTGPPSGMRGYVAGGCLIAPDSYVEESVLGEACSLGAGSRVERSVLGERVQVGAGASLVDAVVLGGTRVSLGHYRGLVPQHPGRALLASVQYEAPPGPGLRLAAGAGMPGDLAPVAGGLAAAFGNGLIALGGDPNPMALLVKDTLNVGLRSHGMQVVDVGEGLWSGTRFAQRHWKCQAACHVLCDGSAWQVVLLAPIARPVAWSLPAPPIPAPAAGPVGSSSARLQTEWLYLEEVMARLQAERLPQPCPDLVVQGAEMWPVLSRWAHRAGVRLLEGKPLPLGFNPDEDPSAIELDPEGPVQIVLVPQTGEWRLGCPQRGILTWPDQIALEAILAAQATDQRPTPIPANLGLLTRQHLAARGCDPRPVPRLRYESPDPLVSLGRLLAWLADHPGGLAEIDDLLPQRLALTSRVRLPVARRATAMGVLLGDWAGQMEAHPDGRGVHLTVGNATATLWFEAAGEDLHLWVEAPTQDEAEALLARMELRLAPVAMESAISETC